MNNSCSRCELPMDSCISIFKIMIIYLNLKKQPQKTKNNRVYFFNWAFIKCPYTTRFSNHWNHFCCILIFDHVFSLMLPLYALRISGNEDVSWHFDVTIKFRCCHKTVIHYNRTKCLPSNNTVLYSPVTVLEKNEGHMQFPVIL